MHSPVVLRKTPKALILVGRAKIAGTTDPCALIVGRQNQCLEGLALIVGVIMNDLNAIGHPCENVTFTKGATRGKRPSLLIGELIGG